MQTTSTTTTELTAEEHREALRRLMSERGIGLPDDATIEAIGNGATPALRITATSTEEVKDPPKTRPVKGPVYRG